jgi:putative ABC transport system permease protein
MNAFLRSLAPVWIALRAVLRNRLRASLTILSITIGIAAVVLMSALIGGASAKIKDQISSIGTNALIIFPQSARASGARTAATGSKLSELDCAALERESTSIRLAVPFLRASVQAVYEGRNAKAEVIGSRLGYLDIGAWKIVRGEAWLPTSESVSEKVVLIGANTAKELFGSSDPVGRLIRIGKYPYRVLGVLGEKGPSPFGQSQDDLVLMPISTMRSHVRATRPNETDAIMMSATSSETTDRAKKQAEEILRQRHNIAEGSENDFLIRSQAELKEIQGKVFGVLTLLLVGVAGVSLLVGGIGVMNIMLVSVTERTREIGIRMAIGAREADILVQFLVESLVLATLGGVVGSLSGYGMIVGISRRFELPMTLDPTMLAIALGTSTMIGLVFGFFPARRAARMDPVQALARE